MNERKHATDVNKDGCVNLEDFAKVAGDWLSNPM
jgi:hypothetical protein